MDDLELDSLKMDCDSLNELPGVARELINYSDEQRVLLFVGDLGAGKTTLIKEICKQLGVQDMASSPTFSIVNEYRDGKGQPVYHFDFYRIKNEQEAVDIGVDEYFYSGNFCFVEWPEKIEGLLPDSLLLIRIESSEGEKRTFNLTRYE